MLGAVSYVRAMAAMMTWPVGVRASPWTCSWTWVGTLAATGLRSRENALRPPRPKLGSGGAVGEEPLDEELRFQTQVDPRRADLRRAADGDRVVGADDDLGIAIVGPGRDDGGPEGRVDRAVEFEPDQGSREVPRPGDAEAGQDDRAGGLDGQGGRVVEVVRRHDRHDPAGPERRVGRAVGVHPRHEGGGGEGVDPHPGAGDDDLPVRGDRQARDGVAVGRGGGGRDGDIPLAGPVEGGVGRPGGRQPGQRDDGNGREVRLGGVVESLGRVPGDDDLAVGLERQVAEVDPGGADDGLPPGPVTGVELAGGGQADDDARGRGGGRFVRAGEGEVLIDARGEVDIAVGGDRHVARRADRVVHAGGRDAHLAGGPEGGVDRPVGVVPQDGHHLADGAVHRLDDHDLAVGLDRRGVDHQGVAQVGDRPAQGHAAGPERRVERRGGQERPPFERLQGGACRSPRPARRADPSAGSRSLPVASLSRSHRGLASWRGPPARADPHEG